MTTSTHRRLAIALVLVAASGLACAFGEIRPNDPLQRQMVLEETQNSYTQYIRFNAFNEASRYVHPEVRGEFLDKAPGKWVHFTDHATRPFDLNETLDRAVITVTYTAYSEFGLYEREVTEIQHWERKGIEWKVRPEFKGLAALIGAGQ